MGGGIFGVRMGSSPANADIDKSDRKSAPSANLVNEQRSTARTTWTRRRLNSHLPSTPVSDGAKARAPRFRARPRFLLLTITEPEIGGRVNPSLVREIGRASCREREYVWSVAVWL